MEKLESNRQNLGICILSKDIIYYDKEILVVENKKPNERKQECLNGFFRNANILYIYNDIVGVRIEGRDFEIDTKYGEVWYLYRDYKCFMWSNTCGYFGIDFYKILLERRIELENKKKEGTIASS